MTNAEKQAGYKARQRAAGKKQVTVWLDAAVWQTGFDFGHEGRAIPEQIEGDELSFLSGYIEGKAKWEKTLVEKARHTTLSICR